MGKWKVSVTRSMVFCYRFDLWLQQILFIFWHEQSCPQICHFQLIWPNVTHTHTLIPKWHKHTCYPCLSCHLWGESNGLSPIGANHTIKHCSQENIHYKQTNTKSFSHINMWSVGETIPNLQCHDSNSGHCNHLGCRQKPYSPFQWTSCCSQSKLCR